MNTDPVSDCQIFTIYVYLTVLELLYLSIVTSTLLHQREMFYLLTVRD